MGCSRFNDNKLLNSELSVSAEISFVTIDAESNSTKALSSDISNFNLFVYNSNGTLQEHLYSNEAVNSINLTVAYNTPYKVYAIANIGEVENSELFRSESNLNSYIHQIDGTNSIYGNTPLSTINGLDVFFKNSGKSILTFEMTPILSQLFIKIDKSRLDSDVSLNVKSISLHNVPNSIYMFRDNCIENSATFIDNFEAYSAEESNIESLEEVIFYMPENIQGAPFGDITSLKERWFTEPTNPKSRLCTYIKISAEYMSPTAYNKCIEYYLYVGGESIKSLDIKRNFCYEYTIILSRDGMGIDDLRINNSSIEYLITDMSLNNDNISFSQKGDRITLIASYHSVGDIDNSRLSTIWSYDDSLLSLVSQSGTYGEIATFEAIKDVCSTGSIGATITQLYGDNKSTRRSSQCHYTIDAIVYPHHIDVSHSGTIDMLIGNTITINATAKGPNDTEVSDGLGLINWEIGYGSNIISINSSENSCEVIANASGSATLKISTESKEGTIVMDIIINVSDKATTITYGTPVVTLSYPSIPASGGTVYPSISYSQTRTQHYISGESVTLSPVTSGGTINYSNTLDNSTGAIYAPSKGTSISDITTVSNVTATVTLNGVSGSASFSVKQEPNSRSIQSEEVRYSDWSEVIARRENEQYRYTYGEVIINGGYAGDIPASGGSQEGYGASATQVIIQERFHSCYFKRDKNHYAKFSYSSGETSDWIIQNTIVEDKWEHNIKTNTSSYNGDVSLSYSKCEAESLKSTIRDRTLVGYSQCTATGEGGKSATKDIPIYQESNYITHFSSTQERYIAPAQSDVIILFNQIKYKSGLQEPLNVNLLTWSTNNKYTDVYVDEQLVICGGSEVGEHAITFYYKGASTTINISAY